MNYEIVRMPTDQDELQQLLEELSPFIDVMYSKADETIFGEMNFLLDHWLFLWDNGAGYFLIGREQGELQSVAMLTQYTDLWCGRPRIDIHRFAVASEALANEKTLLAMVDYLISVASLLQFELLFYTTRDDSGNEIKELIWNSKDN